MNRTYRRSRCGRLVVACLLLLGISATAATAGENKRSHMNTGAPLVGLRLDGQECIYVVYVNGGLVASNMEATPVGEDYPINQFLRSGENELTVHLYRWHETDPDTGELKLAIKIGDADDENRPAVTALTLVYSAKAPGDRTAGSSPPGTFDSQHAYRRAEHGDVTVGKASLTQLPGRGSVIHALSRTFSMHLPFPEWAFFKGEKVKQGWEFKDDQEMEPTYLEIQKAYGELQSLLAKKDVDAFLDACEERSREIDQAFYKKPGETRAALKQQLASAVNDPKFALSAVIKPEGKHWRYTVGSTGKIISLTTGSRGAPILRFRMKDDTPFSLIFPVFFRKQGQRYIVTR
jgi:hypothetical protein